MEIVQKILIVRILTMFSCLFLGTGIGHAQVIDFNQIVPPEGVRPTTFEDYLVQLAWLNNPETKVLAYQKSKEEREVSLTKTKWTDDVKLAFNMNEVSLENVFESDSAKGDNIVLYPLYQFTAAVSLGSFVNTKKKREMEEFDVLIAEQEGNQHKLRIRMETLTRYNKMLLAIETLKVRKVAEEDSRNTFDIANQRFKNNNLEMQDMLQASESYNNALEKRLASETEIELAKLELEEMIGVKWEVAKKYEERLKGKN